MKIPSLLALPLTGAACFFLATAREAGASTIIANFENIDQLIPDGSALGYSDRRIVTTGLTEITSVAVALNITGGFNGDLYAQLTHASGFSVLLNRVGRTAINPTGYTDSGLNVQIQDGPPAAGDIHHYRLTLSGSETTPLAGALSGVWTPDGRAVDPELVLNTSPRTAFLSSFTGTDPNGEWTLFVADLDGGGQSTLRSWGLTIQGVPEPAGGILVLFTLSAWSGFGRWRGSLGNSRHSKR